MIKTFRDGRLKLTGKDYANAKKEKWESQDRMCSICGLYCSIGQAEVDHIISRGMAGSRRDDSPKNIRIVHRDCHFKHHYRTRDAAGWTKKVKSIVEWAENEK